MYKYIKIFFINIFVIFALLFVCNLGSYAIIKTYRHFASKTTDDRVNLSVYSDKEHAKQIFLEFNNLKTNYQPILGWSRSEFNGNSVTINSDGFRIKKNSNKTSNLPILAFFGGSTMWGTGVVDSDTIPAQVENKLNNKIIAKNFAESGYNSRQSLDQLINQINKQENINSAIFYDGVNDIISGCRIGANANTHEQEDFIRFRVESDPGSFKALFSPTLHLLKKLVKHKYSYKYDCDINPVKAERVANILISNWKHARAISKANNINFTAFLQPVSFIGNHDTSELSLDNNMEQQYKVVYKILQNKVKAMQSSGEDWIYDFSESLPEKNKFFLDFCHLNAIGNKEIAERIITKL